MSVFAEGYSDQSNGANPAAAADKVPSTGNSLRAAKWMDLSLWILKRINLLAAAEMMERKKAKMIAADASAQPEATGSTARKGHNEGSNGADANFTAWAAKRGGELPCSLSATPCSQD